jgi:hypothetical protein
VVFTVPPAVAAVGLANPMVVYQLLFRAAAQTVQAVAADPKHLGAQVGLLAVLHTWGQNLHHHPHLHGVASGGGLSCNRRGVVDQEPRWVSCRPGFFLPVRVLGRVFRGKFLAGLRQAFDRQRLRFPGRLAGLARPAAFAAWLRPLYQTDWVVYAKPPFGGPAQVLKYLARYTHRVALSNHRLVCLEEGRVTFRYQDYAADQRQKLLTLDAVEFLRRFVQHVLPRGFVKIRHYGLLANRGRQAKLTVCRQLLQVVTLATLLTAGVPDGDTGSVVAPPARPQCPACGGERFERRPLPRTGPGGPAAPAVGSDTS